MQFDRSQEWWISKIITEQGDPSTGLDFKRHSELWLQWAREEASGTGGKSAFTEDQIDRLTDLIMYLIQGMTGLAYSQQLALAILGRVQSRLKITEELLQDEEVQEKP